MELLTKGSAFREVWVDKRNVAAIVDALEKTPVYQATITEIERAVLVGVEASRNQEVVEEVWMEFFGDALRSLINLGFVFWGVKEVAGESDLKIPYVVNPMDCSLRITTEKGTGWIRYDVFNDTNRENDVLVTRRPSRKIKVFVSHPPSPLTGDVRSLGRMVAIQAVDVAIMHQMIRWTDVNRAMPPLYLIQQGGSETIGGAPTTIPSREAEGWAMQEHVAKRFFEDKGGRERLEEAKAASITSSSETGPEAFTAVDPHRLIERGRLAPVVEAPINNNAVLLPINITPAQTNPRESQPPAEYLERCKLFTDDIRRILGMVSTQQDTRTGGLSSHPSLSDNPDTEAKMATFKWWGERLGALGSSVEEGVDVSFSIKPVVSPDLVAMLVEKGLLKMEAAGRLLATIPGFKEEDFRNDQEGLVWTKKMTKAQEPTKPKPAGGGK